MADTLTGTAPDPAPAVPEYPTRLRRSVNAPFLVKRIEAMRPGIQKIVDDLIDTMLAGPNPPDLLTALALPLPSLVIADLLGVPYSDWT